jgi:hypothetical protein
VTIPNSVLSIGNSAFYVCSGLTNVTMSNNVATIGEHAFAHCPNLTSMTIPNSITSIGGYAFQGCYGLTSVTFHCKEIAPWFSGLSNIKEVVIGDEVTTIGENAFYHFDGITSINIQNSVTSIGKNAFSHCEGLTSISIPNSVTTIGNNAFYGCRGLMSVSIPNGVTVISNGTFEDCNSLMSVDIPNSVTTIGTHAFFGCSNLKSIVIPNSVTTIESEAFSLCSSLYSVTIPNSVINLNELAFYNSAVRIVRVPVMDYSAFCNNGFVSSIWQKIGKPIQLINEEGIEIEEFSIPYGVADIINYAFAGCSDLTNITIPKSVTSLGESAFKDCKGLKSITIPNTVITIGNNTFEGCSGITSVAIPNSVTTIGFMAFSGCPIENVIIRNCHTTNNTSFSYKTYENAILFVPIGTKNEVLNGTNSWYAFCNIREIAMEPSEVSSEDAYMMMNTKDFSYTVYDLENDKVIQVESLNGVDEEKPTSNWQFVKETGKVSLYNIGAQKYAFVSSNGDFAFSSTPTAINIQKGEDGIILDDNMENTWGFVLNEKVQADPNLSGIEDFYVSSSIHSELYSIDGKLLGKLQRGVNIIRFRNGKSQKVVVK